LILVEAAVESLQSALAAERAGVDRIELCVNLDEGGTTPSAELIADVVGQSRLPVFVLIRPRAGGFVYSAAELDAMTREIELAGSMGVAGIVTGALNADRSVDVGHTRILVKAAAGLPVTFHRAFDSTIEPSDALEQVIDAGANRILTSGGAATALEGADAIAMLVDQAGERLSIVAGGSIREHNVREVVERAAAREIHARLVDETRMRNLVAVVRRKTDAGSE
jgi:copper homeostasis protein